MTKPSAALLAVLAALFSAAAAQEQTWTTLSGPVSGVVDRAVVAVRDAEEWKALWEKHAPGTPAPAVDFTKEVVVAAWGAPGETVELIPVEGDASRFLVSRRAAPLAADAPEGAAVDSAAAPAGLPFAMRKVPAHSFSVFVPVTREYAEANPSGPKPRSLEIPALAELENGAFETPQTPDGSAAPVAAASSEPTDPKSKWKAQGWVLVMRGGPTFTNYSPADISLKTPRGGLEMKNVAIGERNDMEWYRLENMKARPGHFIDEPSNDFTIGVENRRKGYAINFVARHPKILIVEEGTINQTSDVTGTLDGRPVNGTGPLNEHFSHWRLTHKFMNYQAQFEKLFTAATRAGAFTLAPGVSAGIYTGYANAGWARPDGGSGDNAGGAGIVGRSLSASLRSTYEIKRFSATAALQLTKAALDYPVLGGTAAHDMNNKTFTIQLGVTLF